MIRNRRVRVTARSGPNQHSERKAKFDTEMAAPVTRCRTPECRKRSHALQPKCGWKQVRRRIEREASGEDAMASSPELACGSKELGPLSRFPAGESRGGRVPPTPADRRLPPQEGCAPLCNPPLQSQRTRHEHSTAHRGNASRWSAVRSSGNASKKNERSS